MKKVRVIVVLFLTLSALSAQVPQNMLPSKMAREQIIEHKAYTMSYSSSYVVPSWLAYKVTNPTVNKEATVKGKYIPDPKITTRAASKKDYKKSGYLMAQLCNYLDVMHIEGAAEETFYTSNIVPMKLAFYQHMWLKTEDLIRLWLRDKEAFYVFTGPITKDAPFPTIGSNKVSVPKHYYKVVYDPDNQEAIAFKFKNGMSSGSLKSYSMSVADLEKITEIDFFPGFDESLKERLKSKVNYEFWNFELEEEL
ncbi:MAG TPA: hypothetical protein DDX98_06535 [Bacteroidales bacterium]|jgi:endonuclease G|nr:hypothetical protein [Bacteroidales bacterium]